MERVLYLDCQPGYQRAAIVEDRQLVEFMAEKQRSNDQTESLFWGRIQSIRKSLNAAFVDIGDDMHAFLPLEEDRSYRCGEMLIVQGAAKQAVDTKGLRVTTKLNLPGKWVVLVPQSREVHISKKIKDPHLRDDLLKLGRAICPPECGLIIRTVSEETSAEHLKAETQALYTLWMSIQKKAAGMSKPGLLHKRESLDMRLIRDLNPLNCIVANSEHEVSVLIREQQEQRISKETAIVYFPEDRQLLFDAYCIESQIDKALKKRVWLPCGGYLIFDFCEAMTVIDVNSGKMTLGKDLEDTALRVNLEAASEIARQLRLRDIGGIVVIDFIDMCEQNHRQMLLDQFKKLLSMDRTQVTLEGLTKLGLLELTRKRVRMQLHKSMRTSCSYCSGMGEILNAEEVAHRALRQVRRMTLSGQRGPFAIRCAMPVAQAFSLIGSSAEGIAVYVIPAAARHMERYDIEQMGEGYSIPKEAFLLK